MSGAFAVEHRVFVADLSQEGFIKGLAAATADLDIGLVVSNAGTGQPGRFLENDRDDMVRLLRLNTQAHLDVAYHFGRRLAARRGGILLVGALGADKGVPYLANDGGAKAYVQSLGEALHVEFKPLGVHVTVLPPGPTDTPVLEKFGLSAKSMPMKPMKAGQCVSEGLWALQKNRALMIPGRLNRIMRAALVPASASRAFVAKMFAKTLANKPATPLTDAEAR